MERVLIALVLVAAAVAVAAVVQRRRPQPQRPPSFNVPTRLERTDFARPDAPWLVAAFVSRTCDTCDGVLERVRPLASDEVAVDEIEVKARGDLHDRYGVDAVPLVVVANARGEVRHHAFGPVTAADLWATIADLRDAEPGTC